MTMTAIQIREALKPMMQFAPAIIACIEIVESAEAAEKALAAATKTDEQRKKALADEIAVLEDVKKKAARELDDARKEMAAFAEATAVKKAGLKTELATAIDEFAKHTAKLEGEWNEKHAKAVEMDKLLVDKQTELDNLKKAFEAFKAAHKL